MAYIPHESWAKHVMVIVMVILIQSCGSYIEEDSVHSTTNPTMFFDILLLEENYNATWNYLVIIIRMIKSNQILGLCLRKFREDC